MMNKLMKKMMLVMLAALIFCTSGVTAHATQAEETTEETAEDGETREATELTFEIAIFTYEMLPDAEADDMPPGFTLGDWEYNGVAVKAGFTENSDMVCVMAEDWESGYQYRFIYDPEHDMFVPYFGAEIKNGYIYTIPMYEDAEVPYGFVDSYFVIQTVPMFTYMREDAELTQEEIAVGSLSEDNYLVFLMMDENGKEVHYTYDLIDRTFQRALLQKKDADKVTELNETIDKLSAEIGMLNADHAERMNKRLTIIGVLIAAVVIMAGIIVNLLLKVSKLKKGEISDSEEDEEDEVSESTGKGLLGFFKKKDDELDEEDFDDEYDDFGEDDEDDEYEEEIEVKKPVKEDDDDLEILDLDLEDL